MKRVGVYVDYSNVYKGARDAFVLHGTPGHRGNVDPVTLARRVAFHAPDGTSRRSTHDLAFVKVFRGAPDPGRQPHAALMEAKRAYQWERWGAQVYRQTLDYGRGHPVEKGVDVRLANTLLLDALQERMDVAVLVSADKDFRYALLNVRDASAVEVEVAIWQAVPGGKALGRIALRPERPGEPEVACHLLGRNDFGRLEDTVDYRALPPPPGWA
jgi:hypothetical protein